MTPLRYAADIYAFTLEFIPENVPGLGLIDPNGSETLVRRMWSEDHDSGCRLRLELLHNVLSPIRNESVLRIELLAILLERSQRPDGVRN